MIFYKNTYKHLHTPVHGFDEGSDDVITFQGLFKYFGLFAETSNIQKSSIFVINIMRFEEFVHGLDYKNFLTNEIKTRINSGKATLVLNHSHERTHKYTLNYYAPLWNMLYEKLVRAGIQKDRTIFVSGDVNIEKTFKDAGDDTPVLGLDLMELAFDKWTRCRNAYDIEVSNFSLQKDYDYLFLNAVPRPQRCVLRFLLHERGLLDKSINSWVIGERRPALDEIKRFINNNNLNLDPNEVFTFSSKEKTVDSSFLSLKTEGNQNVIPKFLLDKTIFSFVTETHIYQNITLVSEKTFKPLLQKHPFMVYSHPEHMHYLQECGYVTYSEMFDESYDYENDENKIKILIDNLLSFKDRVVGKERIIEEKLEYNRQHFLTIPCKEKTKKKLLDFFE